MLRSVDFAELGRQLARTRWGWVLFASAVLGPLGLWARARRWRYLFPPGPEPPGLLAAVMIGYMANNVLPLRAGEFVRIYVVARRAGADGGRRGQAFWLALATLVVERVLDSLVIVLVLAALIFTIEVPAAFRWGAGILLAVDVVGTATLVALAVAPATARRLLARCTRRWPALARRVAPIFETFLRGLDGIRTPAHLAPLLVWTALVWLIPALTAWTMLLALNLDLPFIAAWTVLAFVGLGISIPSAPGYIGVWHAATVLALGIYGVPKSTAVGYALVYHASQFVPITLLGWIFLLREHLSLGDAARARPSVDAPGAG